MMVMPLPGHTPGSLVVTVTGGALVADLLRGAIVGSWAEVHFSISVLDDSRADVRRLVERSPSTSVFFPGHFGQVGRDAVAERFADPRR
jgi:glyoxylase-like metal-dependent hydrolase (beta-lactamase superfamily II)